MNTYFLQTTYGKISIWDSEGQGSPVLLIHGNSTCKEVFSEQMNSALGKQFRLIAIDLPGHGLSDDAPFSEDAYHISWYKKVALSVMNALDDCWQRALPKVPFQRWSAIGWSLGGHIGLDLMDHLQGLIIIGAAPIPCSHEGYAQGFCFDEKSSDILPLLSKPDRLTLAEATRFVQFSNFEAENKKFVESAMRTDGRARKNLVQSFNEGLGQDHKKLVESSPVALAVVVGDNDVVNIKYLQEIHYNNLYEKVFVIENTCHTCFYQKPEKCNEIFLRFLKSIY